MNPLPIEPGRTWKPASAQVSWQAALDRLDGEHWPQEIVLEAWERNDRGERRIKATRVYREMDR